MVNTFLPTIVASWINATDILYESETYQMEFEYSDSMQITILEHSENLEFLSALKATLIVPSSVHETTIHFVFMYEIDGIVRRNRFSKTIPVLKLVSFNFKRNGFDIISLKPIPSY